jgi:hypothetical protein
VDTFKWDIWREEIKKIPKLEVKVRKLNKEKHSWPN